ncbi:MAG: hypothetical protein KatS3mg015_0175 [Fimbriimonadales bacterium]|nr:MAG: hypothetical protein KatS3mg015_0175 [Fimbriimonadales bacterium]
MSAWPFDSLCLAAAVSEARDLVGRRVRRVLQQDERTWLVRFERTPDPSLLIRTRPDYPCAFVASALSGARPERGFAHQLDLHLRDARLASIEQIGFDRLLVCEFEHGTERKRLFACLFGTHAAAGLCDGEDRVLVAERRPEIFPIGRKVQLPEPNLNSIDQALADPQSVGSRPFVAAAKRSPDAILEAVRGGAGWLHEEGPYPVRVAGAARRYPSFSQAVEAWLLRQQKEEEAAQLERQRSAIRRKVEGLRSAQAQLEATLRSGDRSAQLQRKGELLLAFQTEVSPGARQVVLPDFDGNPLEIKLDPELTAVENAERYFAKAKRARNAKPLLEDRIRQIEAQIEELEKLLAADDRTQRMPASEKGETKRFEGQRIREYQGPGGYRILVGLSATANDYLTRRVAKPNDWWLHARGTTGAHVVVPTGNHPERVPKETLEYAARIAARHSSQKHAKTVPVAYTLAKYVRRPRKAAPGTVLLTNETVLFVEPLPFD